MEAVRPIKLPHVPASPPVRSRRELNNLCPPRVCRQHLTVTQERVRKSWEKGLNGGLHGRSEAHLQDVSLLADGPQLFSILQGLEHLCVWKGRPVVRRGGPRPKGVAAVPNVREGSTL